MQYLAFVQRDAAGAYIATLPDFPGCSATAPSWLKLDAAIRAAVKVHVDTYLLPVPTPTPIEAFTEDSAPPDSCWMKVRLFNHEVRPTPRPRRRRTRAVAGPAQSATVVALYPQSVATHAP